MSYQISQRRMIGLLLLVILVHSHPSLVANSTLLPHSAYSTSISVLTSSPSSARSVMSLEDGLSHSKGVSNDSLPISSSDRPTYTDVWQQCQSSLVAYSESVSNGWVTSSVRSSLTKSCRPTWSLAGSASAPYTTIDGYPHVKGSYIKTITAEHTICEETYSSTTIFNVTSPCSIPESKCSLMWQSYLGVTNLANATEPPMITTPPNRPRCSLGDERNISIVCATSTISSLCSIQYQHARLLYWPENVSTTHDVSTPTITSDTYTLISPSVYVSLGSLGVAYSGYQSCTTILPLGVEDPMAGFGLDEPMTLYGALASVFTTLDGLLTLAPDQVSTVIADMTDETIPISSVISSIAYSGLLFHYDKKRLTQKMVYSQLTQPSPEAYYLVPGMIERQKYFPCNNCGEIFDDFYLPQLAVPPGWEDYIPASWRHCDWHENRMVLDDPPIALTAMPEVDIAALPTQMPDTTPAPPPSHLTASPGASAPIISPPTSIPDTSPAPKTAATPSADADPIPDPPRPSAEPSAASNPTPSDDDDGPSVPAPASPQLVSIVLSSEGHLTTVPADQAGANLPPGWEVISTLQQDPAATKTSLDPLLPALTMTLPSTTLTAFQMPEGKAISIPGEGLLSVGGTAAVVGDGVTISAADDGGMVVVNRESVTGSRVEALSAEMSTRTRTVKFGENGKGSSTVETSYGDVGNGEIEEQTSAGVEGGTHGPEGGGGLVTTTKVGAGDGKMSDGLTRTADGVSRETSAADGGGSSVSGINTLARSGARKVVVDMGLMVGLLIRIAAVLV